MMVSRLAPACLAFNEAGIPYAPAFDDIYHSSDGGLAQARHVFLGGNDLPFRWQGRESFVILETGFGLGLNFLATWQAWREDPRRSARLHFVSVEKHPFSRKDLALVHCRWSELASLAIELQHAWPPLTPGAHRLFLDGGRVTLTLFFGDANDLIHKIRVSADALFLDGFAPSKNPDLWQPGLLKAVTRLCAPGTTLATWSVAAEVREALSARRWRLEKRPGFGHKREMLCGVLFGEARKNETSRRALIIGAGLAGAAIAERLAARDWEVLVMERHPGAAMEASGNPVGLLHPMLARDDNIAARLSRAGYLFGLRLLNRLAAEDQGLCWNPCGILQLARSAEQEREQCDTLQMLGFPSEYVNFLSRAAAEKKVGHTVAAGGWHYPAGAWVSPPTLCQALLRRHGERVATRYNTSVARLEPIAGGWRAWSDSGEAIAETPLVVLANAFDAARLAPAHLEPLVRIRGQVTYLPSGTLPFLKHVLCGNGYVTPEVGGFHSLGATFDFDSDPAVSMESHRDNLHHLDGLLPGSSITIDISKLDGRVAFRTTTTDRMPLVGALPELQTPLRREARLREYRRLPGLHALLALGSRGLLWAPIAAELLAAPLSGEPLPVEGDLVDALDPARFLLRTQRRSLGDAAAATALQDEHL